MLKNVLSAGKTYENAQPAYNLLPSAIVFQPPAEATVTLMDP